MPKKRNTVTPQCGMCGTRLVPGMAHVCPSAQRPNVDWIKWAAFVLQFLVLFGTLMWKASSIQNGMDYLKQQQEKDEKTLENIQRYFQKPYDAQQQGWRVPQ